MVLQEMSRVMEEQRNLHPGLTVLKGGDVNATIQDQDGHDKKTHTADWKYRNWLDTVDRVLLVRFTAWRAGV